MMAGAAFAGGAGARVGAGAVRVAAGTAVGRGAAAGSGVRSRLPPGGEGAEVPEPLDGLAAGVPPALRWVFVERAGPVAGVGEPLTSSGGWYATGEPLPAMIASIVRSGVGWGT
jgi:hypothetical protein